VTDRVIHSLRNVDVNKMDSLKVNELFEQTLAGDYDDDTSWAAVTQLRLNGNREIFLQSADWLQSENPLKRARAAAILARLHSAGEAGTRSPFRDEALLLIRQLLEHETNSMVLAEGITALGHLQDIATISVVVKFRDHSDWSVRFAVAFALGYFPEDPIAVPSLICLAGDADPHVRDWAVFSLGLLGDADSTDIREALLRRVFDPDEDVREEATAGLAKRRDVRALVLLRGILKTSEPSVWTVEAAATLLGLPQPPSNWTAEDYRIALDEKFGAPHIA
jgi:HEAT repeat protein